MAEESDDPLIDKIDEGLEAYYNKLGKEYKNQSGKRVFKTIMDVCFLYHFFCSIFCYMIYTVHRKMDLMMMESKMNYNKTPSNVHGLMMKIISKDFLFLFQSMMRKQGKQKF